MSASVRQRVVAVLERMIEEVVSSEREVAEMYSDNLEEMLDGMAAEDCFGTEGQSDPRGDQRNGTFTMRHVEGVDT